MRNLGILILLVVAAGAAFAAWDDPYFRGKPVEKRILMAGKEGAMEDTGVTVGELTNTISNVSTLTNVVATVSNTVAGAEFTANKDVANGYAGLDSNGKINADIIETITIVFAGGEAVDI